MTMKRIPLLALASVLALLFATIPMAPSLSADPGEGCGTFHCFKDRIFLDHWHAGDYDPGWQYILQHSHEPREYWHYYIAELYIEECEEQTHPICDIEN